MQNYSTFRPTPFDVRGLGLREQQNWLVAPVTQDRDSDALARSNFECFVKALGGESEDVQVHSFNHWGPGWFEIVLINPARADLVKLAQEMEDELQDYPVIDEMHYSQLEHEEANEVWRACYDCKERVAYIRHHRTQFEFRSFSDLLDCVRGNYFGGYASELLTH